MKKIIGQGPSDPAQIARGEALFNDLAKVLDAHLANRDWLAGSGATLADISVGCPLMVAPMAELPLASYANIQRWFARVQELDGWKKTA